MGRLSHTADQGVACRAWCSSPAFHCPFPFQSFSLSVGSFMDSHETPRLNFEVQHWLVLISTFPKAVGYRPSKGYRRQRPCAQPAALHSVGAWKGFRPVLKFTGNSTRLRGPPLVTYLDVVFRKPRRDRTTENSRPAACRWHHTAGPARCSGGTRTQAMPAAFAAWRPVVVSSKTRHCSGTTFSRRAASRKGSGCGLPRR